MCGMSSKRVVADGAARPVDRVGRMRETSSVSTVRTCSKCVASDSLERVGIGLANACDDRLGSSLGVDSRAGCAKNHKKQAQIADFLVIRYCPSVIVASQWMASAIREGSSVLQAK